MILDGETILPDEYPVHAGYYYLLDGLVTESDVSGTVATLKRATGATEVRRCELAARIRMAEDRARLTRRPWPTPPATTPEPRRSRKIKKWLKDRGQ